MVKVWGIMSTVFFLCWLMPNTYYVNCEYLGHAVSAEMTFVNEGEYELFGVGGFEVNEDFSM